MPRYSHAFDIAFTVESTDPTGETVTAAELLAALESRIAQLRHDPEQLIEACGMPFDTYQIADAPASGGEAP